MAKSARRKFQDSEKVAILKRHLVEKVPVSDLCDEYKLYPNQFYDWLKKFFENGHLAFAQGRKPKADEQGKDRKIEQLETKLTRKNEVRLHSAIGYVAPRVRLENRHLEVFAERDRKLAAAREIRQQKRRQTPGAASRERSPAPGTTPTMPSLDFAAVRAAVTMRDVLQLLGFQSRTTHGPQQRGACPVHGAATANYFSVNLQQQVFHCFKCGRSGNQLDLWAYATRQTPYDAALDLCQRRNIPVAFLHQNREEEPVENPQLIP